MSELNIERDAYKFPMALRFALERAAEVFKNVSDIRRREFDEDSASLVRRTLSELDDQLNHATAPVSTPQQSAQRASVEEDVRFQVLLYHYVAARWHLAEGKITEDEATDAFRELIAHINAWGSAGSGAIPEGWISVDERLPEEDVDVLIAYWPYDDKSKPQRIGQSYLYDGCFWSADGNLHHWPSHWMPLLDLPKLAATPSPAPQGEQA